MEVINDLVYYDNLKIYQDTDMFSFSLDSVLLPNFVTLRTKDSKIMDIGTGNAVMPLILTTRTKAKIEAVEIQEKAYKLALRSVKLNEKENQIEVINADINELYKEIQNDSYDVVICNPPYFKYTGDSRTNESNHKTIARHEIHLDIERLVKVSKKILKNNGILGLVHRPERLAEIIIEMKNNNIEPKKIRFVYPKKEKAANILLIEGVKNGKPGLKILPPLYSHEENGEYTEEILKYFR